MNKELFFETRDSFRKWLVNNGQTSEGIWLIFGKTDVLKTLSAHEALEEALCFGWIDGLIVSIDKDRYRKYFSRRIKVSNWSDKNRKLAEKLIAENKMTEFGLQVIEEAKKNGQWHKVHDRSISETQKSEFESKLAIYDKAFKNYCAMSPSTQKQFTGFYFEAKREETRQKRLEKIVRLLEENRKLMG
ncbi:YdeI family protein [Prevotella sp. 10(H)]|uniref:YdeI/OmpD-associated family protein n=1 Tax=Prevotella sp. 10(H) TaxID=1158294 RepID=UPI0004A6BBB3|nr:YdeI/OmpD-associated family protein [Prevotella sp. 10(H)]